MNEHELAGNTTYFFSPYQSIRLALENNSAKNEPFGLQKLKTVIEKKLRNKHAPSEFAQLLFITLKALGRLMKTHYHKTPSELTLLPKVNINWTTLKNKN